MRPLSHRRRLVQTLVVRDNRDRSVRSNNDVLSVSTEAALVPTEDAITSIESFGVGSEVLDDSRIFRAENF